MSSLLATRPPTYGAFGVQRGSGWEMGIVRWGTLSRYGHACICIAVDDADGVARTCSIVEAMPNGVRVRHGVAWDEFVWSDVPLTNEQAAGIVTAALAQVGKRYDWPAIGSFVLRWLRVQWTGRSLDHPDVYLMCSELVVYVYRIGAALDLFPGIAARDVAPGDLGQLMAEHW